MEGHENKMNSETRKPQWKTFSGKVLVAEDNPANRILIDTLLKKHGLQTILTENGRRAVEAALAESFDLILMDMQMPVMNGYEATEELRQKGVTVPIIALTASVMVGDRKKCLESGCDDYLSKPIDRRRLQDLLGTALAPADTVQQQLDQLNEQTHQLNQLVNDATPTASQSILKDEPEDK